MHKFTDLETVVLTHDIPEHDLKEGDMGAVVMIHGKGEAGEVEFVTATGRTVALLTLTSSDVRSVKNNDVLHVRGFSAA